MSLVLLLVLSFANWRLAHLLAEEGGPWDYLAALRVRLGVRYDEYSQPYGTNVVASAMLCVWCNSVWVGVFQALATLLSQEVALWIFLPFALSATAIVIDTEINNAL